MSVSNLIELTPEQTKLIMGGSSGTFFTGGGGDGAEPPRVSFFAQRVALYTGGGDGVEPQKV
jgi:hypothetical protein